MNRWPVLIAACSTSLVTAPVSSQGLPAAAIADNPEREAFFGDLHLHTAYSFDAVASGTQTTPEDAYRYALGQPVEYMGRPVQINRPLDFLAVTDHAEYLGVPYEASALDGMLAGTRWPDVIADVEGNTLGYMNLFSPSGFRGSAPVIEELTTGTIVETLWQRSVDAAERFNRPGEFTALVGYEWSPMPGGAHLHRNVIFRGPEYPDRPFSSLNSQRPEDLWTFVENLRARDIDSVLIPHNPNMSQGLMFAVNDSNGDPITREYAARRLLNERLVEITQNKGTSETRPEFSPDEFAGFELLTLPAEANSDPAGSYVRPALGRGLGIEAAIGINPFRFGLIGSTDFHSGVASTEEHNFPGALGRSDDMQDPVAVLTETNPISRTAATVFSSSGLTGVWAESNTRESIFDALNRREVFATSGTRLRVRLFAGWDFPDDLLERDDWIEQAYSTGVPMGADLSGGSDGESGPLKLVIHATREPDGANLDRVQVIKIWREGGEAREAIIDVAWSGEREPQSPGGRIEPVGNSVDLQTANYSNSIGAAQLSTIWTDENFDPAAPAVYYVRVLEISTPRWSTYLAIRNDQPLPDDVPATIQERAWTSPVFYSP